MSKVPSLVNTGGYFPCLDHSVPIDVPFENFRYFIELLREIRGDDHGGSLT
jgi:uroporphyrinogen decarboxylase